MTTTRSKKSARPKASAAKSGRTGAPKRRAAKAGARPKGGAKAATKPKAPARAAKPARRSAAKPAAKAARPAVKPAAKPAARAVAKVPAAPAAKNAAKPAAAAAVAAKGGARGAKPVAQARPGKPGAGAKGGKSGKPVTPPVVRPLGVLPPEARAHVPNKPAAIPPRPRPNPAPAASPASSLGVQRVSEKDMKYFEERLLAERAKILKEMGHLETTVLKVNQRDSSGDLSGYSFHMADAGTDAMEREKAFMFASSEGRLLMEINDALRRLYQGSYGICESCGNPIARARLEAMPHARLCVACKEQEEKASRSKTPTPGPVHT